MREALRSQRALGKQKGHLRVVPGRGQLSSLRSVASVANVSVGEGGSSGL